jgi:N-acetylneuraminate synthase
MKTKPVQINKSIVGPNEQCYLIAEIGINHNGSIKTAKQLIDKAVQYDFNAVKFQKRTVDIVYSEEELKNPRESFFGNTNGDLKRGLEFNKKEFEEIDAYCKQKGIDWFCSPWDENSVDFLEEFNPICYKVASASLTDNNLLKKMADTKRPIILSTGMSTLEEIDQAVSILSNSPLIILHCTSTYPSNHEELNLSVIETFKERFSHPIGYSGHETDIIPSVMAAVGFGACVIERHITLDRAMWGSDQAASLEPRGMELMVKYIRQWPSVKGDGKKIVYDSEIPIREKLRRVGPSY